jgi:hypothetical protein
MLSVLNTISHATLSHLAATGSVQEAEVIGQPGGWGVVIKCGAAKQSLASRRGSIRIFRKFETLACYLKGMGIAHYKVNASNFDISANNVTQIRPDSSERMRVAHEAAAYNDWLKVKISRSLDGLANGTNQIIEPEEWAKMRAAKRASSIV